MPTPSEQPSLADYFETFQRRRKTFFAISGSILAIALLLAIGLPDVYMSNVEMRVDLEGPSGDLQEPLALTSYAEQYVDSLRQRALRQNRLVNWIENNTDIYAEYRNEYSTEDLVAMLLENILIEMRTTQVTDPRSGRPLSLITGFSVGVTADEPEDARKIAALLAWSYLEADKQIRSERAQVAAGFLRAEIEQKRERINDLQGRIAKFKEANAGALPQLMGLNMSVLERTERDIENIDMDIQSLEQDKMFRASQLQEILETSKNSDRIRQLRAEYLRTVSIYGPDHPDVIRIQRQVAALTDVTTEPGEIEEVQRLELELAEARQRYSDVHPDVRRLQRELEIAKSRESVGAKEANINPRYLQLDAQVNAIESQIAGLRDRRQALKIKYDDTQDRIAQMPQVEREYLELMRDLESEEAEFNDLGRRLGLAQRTESFEAGKTGARLIQARGAFLPTEPSSPPRITIMVIAVIVGFSLGIGAILAAEIMDTTVRNKRDIETILNVPPIAEIPVISVTASVAGTRRKVLIIGTAILLASTALLITRSVT